MKHPTPEASSFKSEKGKNKIKRKKKEKKKERKIRRSNADRGGAAKGDFVSSPGAQDGSGSRRAGQRGALAGSGRGASVLPARARWLYE